MTSVLVFISILAISQFGYSWVLTDIDYRMLKRNRLEDFSTSSEDYDSDLGQEEFEDFENLRFSLTYPGTKWCGPGNVANGYEDLGSAEDTDRCCREHDNCADTIPAGGNQYNLTNEAYYTRLSCQCDETFRMCLRETNKKSSNTIGLMYFNVIGTQCFRQDHKIKKCIKKGGWLGTKCVEYSYDTNSEKIHQWFDVPNY